MSSSCQHLITALKECLLRSDCVVKQGHLPSECLKDHTNELPEECKSLRLATFECKRGMLDMRKRFRGNNVGLPPKAVRTESAAPTPAEV
ncbi:hypothetical protein WOLCODRAFT_69748 [Wolfiporia cocos MD-104 SS10]|uniref:Cytochrome c oxidase assembly protein n=1 Tax=Wolfiporia cocos (strain MD-104) TaxID=742152 RepID=A0A2H3JNA1_WOLCO|nr:hypothetical protein WOLCODRAFT_69748 [Wolfiporia cocos MD-104 SS10]